jgi:DNA-directed RNA polymerase specialized sigma24 family protein
VTRDEALTLLPTLYSQALDLLEEGWEPDRIASELDIDASAIDTLLQLAEAKLARLLHQG